METPDDTQVLHDFSPDLRVYKSGRIQRLNGTDVVAAGTDLHFPVFSRDLILLPTGLSARLFVPATVPATRRIPILLHFHGGGFIVGSPVTHSTHNFLAALVSASGSAALSVNYRLAPEHALPAAHDDCWAALQWLLSHSGGPGPDPWLNAHVDFDRVFLIGESAGANIAHHVALRSAHRPVAGAILVHPFFWGTADMGPMSSDPDFRALVERLWRFVRPDTTGVDDPLINPMAGGAVGLAELGCGRVLVCLAGKDKVKEWGQAYYRGLAESGWQGVVEVVEAEGEEHAFHVHKPDSDNTKAMIDEVANFINRQD